MRVAERAEGPPVLTLIRAVQSGSVSGRTLDAESRRSCVAYLTGEGYSVAEIAQVLGVSDRTIARDRVALREAASVARDPRLVERMVGQLLAEAEGAMGRLRRIGRERGAPPAVRVEAERSAWGVLRDLVRLLQRLGYLPEATREIRAELRLGEVEAPSLEEITIELERLEEIQRVTGESDEDTLARIDSFRGALARIAMGERVTEFTRLLTSKEAERHDPHESHNPHDPHEPEEE